MSYLTVLLQGCYDALMSAVITATDTPGEEARRERGTTEHTPHRPHTASPYPPSLPPGAETILHRKSPRGTRRAPGPGARRRGEQ